MSARETMIQTPAWDQTQVSVACPDGMVEVPAITHPWCPGLAVTMRTFGVYRVTHVGSGLAIGGRYERVGSACLELTQWAAIGRAFGVAFDTADPKVLADAIKAHADKPVPFEGATWSSGGVTQPMTLTEWAGIVRGNQPDDEFPWESYEDTAGCRADKILATFAPNDTPQGADA